MKPRPAIADAVEPDAVDSIDTMYGQHLAKVKLWAHGGLAGTRVVATASWPRAAYENPLAGRTVMSKPVANPTRLSSLPETEDTLGVGRLFRDARELPDEELPRLRWRLRTSQRL